MSVLKLKDVHKSFAHPAGKVDVLNGVSAEVVAGESVAIIGPSGSGKSTLLALIAGLEPPDSGQVLCMNEDLTTMNEQKLTAFRARHQSIVFQQFRLMSHMTALENVRLPIDLAAEDEPVVKARAALERVGLGDRINHFPRQLSGGECQRVAIARALVTKPALLLADEPSGNLDGETGRKVMDLLFALVQEQNTALVLVTHDLALAKRCGRQLAMSKGLLHAN